MKPLNIVFAGTPAFTLPCLDAIAASKHNLQAIYTQPDRPAGRGRKLQASAVKEWAQAHQLPIYQPLNFKSKEAIDELKALAPDVMVVIAYGLILPQAVLDIPRLGCINVHASLLPSWRGASPIQHALLFGDEKTGITIMQMDSGMDTGPMLVQVSCTIASNDTATTLHDKLAELSTAPLLETLDKIAMGIQEATEQDNTLATYAPKINKTDAAIDWYQSAKVIDQKIRAFNPWPTAYTQLHHDLIMRIHQAQVIADSSTHLPGTILAIDKHGIRVSTGHGVLLIERIQFPGGKAITIAEWLNAKRDNLSVNMVLQ